MSLKGTIQRQGSGTEAFRDPARFEKSLHREWTRPEIDAAAEENELEVGAHIES